MQEKKKKQVNKSFVDRVMIFTNQWMNQKIPKRGTLTRYFLYTNGLDRTLNQLEIITLYYRQKIFS